jgi:Ca-activated chloride channel family protein
MRPMAKLTITGIVMLLLFTPKAWGQNLKSVAGQIGIPNRASTPLFKGEQGKQRTEIHFDRAAEIVTIKLLVQDPNGYFIPNIRRDNFAVYEDGVRQTNATVDIEHAAVSLGLLVEYGGHYQGLNGELVREVSRASHQLLDVLGEQDKIVIWAYGDTVKQIADSSQGRETIDRTLLNLQAPGVSETNLYDAVLSALGRMRAMTGRKAMILISSGVDTFSKATYEDVLAAARNCDTPIYIIGLGPVLRDAAELHGTVLATRIDWHGAETKLQEIARLCGGRFYAPISTIDLSAIYDDMMENLKVRYVITYKSSNTASLSARHTIRVELVNPKTGGPLQIVDADGKKIDAKAIVEGGYSTGGE